jgi:hypothetical protein
MNVFVVSTSFSVWEDSIREARTNRATSIGVNGLNPNHT